MVSASSTCTIDFHSFKSFLGMHEKIYLKRKWKCVKWRQFHLVQASRWVRGFSVILLFGHSDWLALIEHGHWHISSIGYPWQCLGKWGFLIKAWNYLRKAHFLSYLSLAKVGEDIIWVIYLVKKEGENTAMSLRASWLVLTIKPAMDGRINK